MQTIRIETGAAPIAGGSSHLREMLANQPVGGKEPAHHVGLGTRLYLIIAGACCALMAWFSSLHFFSGMGSSQDEENNPVANTTEGKVHVSNPGGEDFIVGGPAEGTMSASTPPRAKKADAEVGVDGQKGNFHCVFEIQTEEEGQSAGQFQHNEFYGELLRCGAVRSVEVNPDGRCCLYALAGVDAARGRIMGQQWGLPSEDHCDQYADIFANAAQEFVLNVTEEFINSEDFSSALLQLSQAIESGQECGELEKHEVKVGLNYRGRSYTFSFPCGLLLDQFVVLLEEYRNTDEVGRWQTEQGAHFASIIESFLKESAETYYRKFSSELYYESDNDPWVQESLGEIMHINRSVGRGIGIDGAGQLDWKDPNLLTQVKGILGIGDQIQGVNPSIPKQLGRIIWEYESQCNFLYSYFLREKNLPMASFLFRIREVYQEQLDRMEALFRSTFAHTTSPEDRENQQHFLRVVFQAVLSYKEQLEMYTLTSNMGLGSLLTRAFSIGPERWQELLTACVQHRRDKRTFRSITELEMLMLSYHFTFAVLAQSVDGNYTWCVYKQGRAHCIDPSSSEEQETLLQSCAKEGFLFQRAAGVHFDCALTKEGWQEYQCQNQGRDSARSLRLADRG